MKIDHLSAWDQEEYVLGERTPQMLRHLSECAQCGTAVERLEQGVAGFRMAATAWSSECLEARPQQQRWVPGRAAPAWRWAVAAMIPLVLLLLALVPRLISFHGSSPVRPVAAISDDALLDQVDEQVSVAVPSSMESLTHLVSTGSGTGEVRAAGGGKHLAQTN